MVILCKIEGENMKKLTIIALILFVSVISTMTNHVSAAFSDVGDRYKESVEHLVFNNYAQGLTDTKFGTESSIKRIDAAVMVARVMGFTEGGNYPDAGFTDVPKDRVWAVNALANVDVISGKEIGRYGSGDPMTRSEMAKVIASAYSLEAVDQSVPFTDVSSRFVTYVAALVENKVAFGKTTTQFGANDFVTRGEFSLFILRGDRLDVEGPPEVISVE
jgi:hypothetical protein